MTQKHETIPAKHDKKNEVRLGVEINEASGIAMQSTAKAIERRKIYRENIDDVVDSYLGLLKSDEDHRQVAKYKNDLAKLTPSDAVDRLIVKLDELYRGGELSETDVFANADKILRLSHGQYTSVEDLLKRRQWLKEMNLERPEIPLEENHKLVTNTFDNFNKLIGLDFDVYYVGGAICYLASNHMLERYHGDLDIMVNERQLAKLRERIKDCNDFDFKDNMANKMQEDGHEYKIVYKHGPMSIGIFLFDRNDDGTVTQKAYYKKKLKDADGQIKDRLYVREDHFSKKYVDITFSDEIRTYHGYPYKMVSPESIFSYKRGGRPKDQYDARIMRDIVDMNKVNDIDKAGDRIWITRKPADKLPL